MDSLIIAAHGSRKPESNEETARLAARVTERLGSPGPDVRVAFLELTIPTLDEQLDAAVAAGARSVAVYPLFLAAGAHVTRDLPEAVDRARQRHPDVTFEQLPHLGAAEGLDALIAAAAKG